MSLDPLLAGISLRVSCGRSSFKIYFVQLGVFDQLKIIALREGLRIFDKPTGDHIKTVIDYFLSPFRNQKETLGEYPNIRWILPSWKKCYSSMVCGMKVRFLLVSGILIALFLSFWAYGNSIITIGERESRWILKDMWGSSYFYARMEGLEEHERINLLSLREGSSKNQELIDYVMKNICTDYSVRCYLVMTSASNLLTDAREYDSGLKGMVEAINRVSAKELCPIAYESAILRYKIEVVSSKNIWSVRRSAIEVLEKIKSNNGFMKSLKNGSCTSLAREKPEIFQEYTRLIVHLMGFAGGDYAKAGAYIDSLRNNEG